MDYSVEINTIEGVADHEYLDRLADLVYERKSLIDPLLALNDDGSVSASFCVRGPNPLQAANDAVELFLDAVAAAEPLRLPTPAEVARGKAKVTEKLGHFEALGSFTVSSASSDREAVYA
jgi:hypothetical protein